MILQIEAEVFEEGSVMVAHAKGLDVSSCGKTTEEALQALMEAVQLFAGTAQEMGTLDEILVESGFVHRQGDQWAIPPVSSPERSPEDIVPTHYPNLRLACVQI